MKSTRRNLSKLTLVYKGDRVESSGVWARKERGGEAGGGGAEGSGGAARGAPRGVQCEKSTVSACSTWRMGGWVGRWFDDDDGDEQRTRNVCQVWVTIYFCCGNGGFQVLKGVFLECKPSQHPRSPLPPLSPVVFLSLKINLSWHLHLPGTSTTMTTTTPWSQVDVVEMPLELRLKLWNWQAEPPFPEPFSQPQSLFTLFATARWENCSAALGKVMNRKNISCCSNSRKLIKHVECEWRSFGWFLKATTNQKIHETMRMKFPGRSASVLKKKITKRKENQPQGVKSWTASQNRRKTGRVKQKSGEEVVLMSFTIEQMLHSLAGKCRKP